MAETVKLKTTGMHCQSCSMMIELTLTDLEGVESVRSDYKRGETDVTFDSSRVGVGRIVDEIRKAGYGAEVAP